MVTTHLPEGQRRGSTQRERLERRGACGPAPGVMLIGLIRHRLLKQGTCLAGSTEVAAGSCASCLRASPARRRAGGMRIDRIDKGEDEGALDCLQRAERAAGSE